MLFPFALMMLPTTQGLERIGMNSFWPEYERWEYKSECQIDNRAFTGFRLMDVYEFNVPSRDLVRNDMVLLSCNMGTPQFDVTLKPDSVFNTPIEVPSVDSTFRLARRDVYAHRAHNATELVRGSMYGAIYIQKGRKWEAISPLITDLQVSRAPHYGFDNRTVKFTYVMSALRTPEPLDKAFPRNNAWKMYVSPYE